MKNISKDFTYGVELEFADIDRQTFKLPSGCSWALAEKDIMNSDGRAIDSRKKSEYFIGGEINTPPTKTVKDTVKIIKECLKSAKINLDDGDTSRIFNQRTEYHVHIGLPEELINLKNMKILQKYFYEHCSEIKNLSMPLPSDEARKNRRWYGTFQEKMVAPYKQEFLMKAENIEGFRKAFFFSKKGTIAHITFFRQGINVYSLFKHGTVESRLAWQTDDLEAMENQIRITKDFVSDALTGGTKFNKIMNKYRNKKFPLLPKFSSELEKIYHETKWSK